MKKRVDHVTHNGVLFVRRQVNGCALSLILHGVTLQVARGFKFPFQFEALFFQGLYWGGQFCVSGNPAGAAEILFKKA